MGGSNLYIYLVDDLQGGKLTPHKRNPVVMDSRYARNAGRIYERYGDIIRPSQWNVKGIYGAGLNFMKITKLNLDEFEQELIQTIEPRFKPGLDGLHHLDQIESCFVFDFAYRKITMKEESCYYSCIYRRQYMEFLKFQRKFESY